MKIKKNDIYMFLLQLCLICILNTEGFEKYIFVFIFFSLVFITQKKEKINKDFLSIIAPNIFLVIYGLLIAAFKSNVNYYSFKEVIFYIEPLLLTYGVYLIAIKKNVEISRIINFQFYVYIFIAILEYVYKYIHLIKIESTLSFVLGLFSIYYINEKKWLKVIVSMIFIIWGGKRIVLLSVALSIILYAFILLKNKIKKNDIRAVFGTLIISIFSYIYALRNGIINSFLQQYEIIDYGRLSMYKMFEEDYYFSFGFVGQGLGYILNKLDNISIGILNLHSDWLHIYITIGLLGVFIYIYMYYRVIIKMYKKRKLVSTAIMVLFYTFFLYFTDNTAIYIIYLYPFNLILYKQIRE